MFVYLVGILACFVEVAESADFHAMQTLYILDIDVEVTSQIRGEVVFRHLEEQLVLVQRVGSVSQHKQEVSVAVGAECLLLGGVLVVEHFAST